MSYLNSYSGMCLTGSWYIRWQICWHSLVDFAEGTAAQEFGKNELVAADVRQQEQLTVEIAVSDAVDGVVLLHETVPLRQFA